MWSIYIGLLVLCDFSQGAGCGEACFEKGMFLSLAKSRNLKNLN